jgi:threonine/homoserine/homoserine lactone efflux protein
MPPYMNASELTALIALATAASFTPGPNTTLSAAMGAQAGLRHAMPFVCGVPVGWCALLMLSALGVGATVTQQPALRTLITALGCGYLLWLAWRIAHAPVQLSALNTAPLRIGFWQAIALQFVNIKGWMLSLSVAAGWLNTPDDLWARAAWVLPLMAFYGFSSNLLYAWMGSRLREWLQVGGRMAWFNRGMASLLGVTAVWMLVTTMGRA